MRVPVLVVLAVLAVVLPAAAASPSTTEQRAVDLINKATSRAHRTADCPQSQRPPESTVNHDAPSQELLNLLGVLRRPASPEDAPADGAFRFLPGSDVDIDYVRVAHAADGRSYWIVPARDTVHFDALPQSCLHRIHILLRKFGRAEPARVRRRALHFYNQLTRSNRRLATRGAREGVFVLEKRGDGMGGGGGGGGVAYLRKYGQLGSSGTNDGTAIVNGLVPDGVATVTSTFGTTYSRGPGHKPRRYPKAITRTDPVQDNMLSFQVARSAEDALPEKMVWRDGDGKVVRVVRHRI